MRADGEASWREPSHHLGVRERQEGEDVAHHPVSHLTRCERARRAGRVAPAIRTEASSPQPLLSNSSVTSRSPKETRH